jgi:predicted SAM-dependent methyltransferase
MVRLHLGSGSVLKDGWQNLDAMYGDMLPGCLKRYADNSVDEIFSEHFIEHLTFEDALATLKECRRILKPGAAVRISCPDLRKLIGYYLEGNIRAYAEGWLPVSPCAMVNEGMRLWGHTYVYDGPEMLRLAALAGFSDSSLTEKHAECVRHDFGDLYWRGVKA